MLRRLTENARGLLAFASLTALSVGCAIERPSLGLIVPGAIVFLALAWSHASGRAG